MNLLGHRVRYGDVHELVALFEEIFINRVYAFEDETTDPLVLDGGANIGLATLFFKRERPDTRVIAFEPNPATFEMLEHNVGRVPRVTLVNAALAERHGNMTLHQVAAGDIGASRFKDYRLMYHEDTRIRSVEVATVPLSDYLTEPVALLKLDVEGSEGMTLAEAGSAIRGIARLRIEFHRFPGQRLQPILDLLDDEGFDYALDGWSPHPTTPLVGTCFIRAWQMPSSSL
jgi:FkbM family methyltransferase